MKLPDNGNAHNFFFKDLPDIPRKPEWDERIKMMRIMKVETGSTYLLLYEADNWERAVFAFQNWAANPETDFTADDYRNSCAALREILGLEEEDLWH